MSLKTQPIFMKNTDEYEAGCEAFRSGLNDNANPFPPQEGNSSKRLWWYEGYYDAKYLPLYDKMNNIKFPQKDKASC
jgi:hypothetical protein